MDSFFEENLDVLQNLEFGTIQRHPPALRLGDRARRVFTWVQSLCEARLGRPLPSGETLPLTAVPVSTLVRCLREIQKSIARWSRQGGRRGYLDFVSRYLPH
jgi:hypothetical protein